MNKINHQKYEINFILGLANYEGDASLITEIRPNTKEWAKISFPNGDIFSFDNIDFLQGSEPNTSKTMVSFDSRLPLEEFYFDSEASSLNTKGRFKIGEYFSEEVIK